MQSICITSISNAWIQSIRITRITNACSAIHPHSFDIKCKNAIHSNYLDKCMDAIHLHNFDIKCMDAIHSHHLDKCMHGCSPCACITWINAWMQSIRIPWINACMDAIHSHHLNIKCIDAIIRITWISHS